MAALVLLAAGCASDDATQDRSAPTTTQPETKGLTEFAMVERPVQAKAMPMTRTSGEYTGSAIRFHWTANDRLWINNVGNATPLKASTSSTIPTDGSKVATAKFYFDDVYSAPKYPVRYTGNGNNDGDKVQVRVDQSQDAPTDGAHIGVDGDCGTAEATRQGDGSYLFTLKHQAAYLTFMPYDGKGALASTVSIKQIKVTATEHLAGIFGFTDAGIQREAVTDASHTVTLSLKEGAFGVPKDVDYSKNAAIMVVAPGTYTNFTVEYTLADTKTSVTCTVSKTYPSVTLNAGVNMPVKFNLGLNHYDMKYYLWDAKQDYWFGYGGTLPVSNGETAAYPAGGTDRWLNEVQNNTMMQATNSLQNSLNANEASLYAFRGTPHWDGASVWVMNGHLYQGGMWFKKLQYCNRGPYHSPVTVYPDGQGDYRQNSRWENWKEKENDPGEEYHAKWTTTVTQGKPSDTSEFFFLPAMGYVSNFGGNQGKLLLRDSGYYGAYWTSTGVVLTSGSLQGVSLHFSDTEVGLEIDDRGWGYPTFSPQ